MIFSFPMYDFQKYSLKNKQTKKPTKKNYAILAILLFPMTSKNTVINKFRKKPYNPCDLTSKNTVINKFRTKLYNPSGLTSKNTVINKFHTKPYNPSDLTSKNTVINTIQS